MKISLKEFQALLEKHRQRVARREEQIARLEDQIAQLQSSPKQGNVTNGPIVPAEHWHLLIELMSASRRSERLAAIKVVRALTGNLLMDSKEMVEKAMPIDK